MHIPSLKIDWHLPKLSAKNKNNDMWQADNSVKNQQNLPIDKLKPFTPDIHVNTKFEWNPSKSIQVRERKPSAVGWAGRGTDWWTLGGENIIPHHYHEV